MDGRALAAVGAGSLFVWSGIKGWSVLATIGDVIGGRKPAQSLTTPLTVPYGGVGTAASGSASGLADAALQYKEHCYRFGGVPGRDGSQCWDCSSFVNYVAAVKLGLPIPGYAAGKYDGGVHGPATGQWAVWPGLNKVSRSEVQAGDIIVWPGHMGIAISNTTMISALNPRSRTVVSSIDAFGRKPILRIGRYG